MRKGSLALSKNSRDVVQVTSVFLRLKWVFVAKKAVMSTSTAQLNRYIPFVKHFALNISQNKEGV